MKHANVLRHRKLAIWFWSAQHAVLVDGNISAWGKWLYNFTGTVYEVYGAGALWYIKEGSNSRELGPCGIYDDGTVEYCYAGKRFGNSKEYWGIMFEKYKGTEHEVLCLAQMLASDG